MKIPRLTDPPPLSGDSQDRTRHQNERAQMASVIYGDTQVKMSSRDKGSTPTVQKKAPRAKNGKTTDVPIPNNINDDQLKLAQSYIVTLERKVNDLEDSYRLLKQENQNAARMPESSADNARYAQPASQGGPESRLHETPCYNDAAGWRERFNMFEMELRSRLLSLVMLMTRVAPPHLTPSPGMHYPYPGLPIHGMMYQMPQIPVPVQPYTQMPVHMPYISMPPPYTVPGNIYHPTQLPFNQVPLMPHAVSPQAGHTLAGYRLLVNPNAGQHTAAQPRAPDGNRHKPAANSRAQTVPNVTHRTGVEHRPSVPTSTEKGKNDSLLQKNPIRVEGETPAVNVAAKLRTSPDFTHSADPTANQSPHRMSVLSPTHETTQFKERGGKVSEPAESDGIRVATHSSEDGTCQQENPAQQDSFFAWAVPPT